MRQVPSTVHGHMGSPFPIWAHPGCLQGCLLQSLHCRCPQGGGNCCQTCLLLALCWHRLGAPELLQPPASHHAGRAAQAYVLCWSPLYACFSCQHGWPMHAP